MGSKVERRGTWHLGLCLAVAVALLGAATAGATVTRYLTGNAADVSPALYGPAYDIGGGGVDVDAAIQWMIDQVRGCTSCATKVDVVVLRSSGSNGYNAPIYAMNGVDSVETLVLTTPADANRSDVEATVRAAEVVFFAGGDQCTYVEIFKGSLVESAVEAVVARGGAVGGTSAGAAIQGEAVYDACAGSVTSSQALADPYHAYVSFTYSFFNWNNFERVITDTHFVPRDRMGRIMAFLARQIQDGRAATPLGMAVNEGTSLVVDRFGQGTVMGAGPVYMVLADHQPERCVAGQSLSFSNFKIWKLATGTTFDLANRPTCGYYRRSVTNGAIDGDPYEGTPVACGDPPSIAGFSPTAGAAGTSVTVSGANLAGATAVAFNGVSAAFTVQSASQIAATVPAAATSGPITVTTPFGSATSAASFTVTGGGFAESEPNDSRSAANDISGQTFPVTVTGTIGSASDTDYFKVTVARKKKLVLDLTVPACCDYDMYLLSSAGSTLARSTNDGAGVAEAIRYTNSRTSTQTYYIQIVRYAGSGGAYSLQVAKQ